MADGIDMVWSKGLKRTKSREDVLAVLEQAQSPLTAAEICTQIEGTGKAVWMSTVYRVLDTFLEREVAVKTAVLDNGMALYELNSHKHKHYAICIGCQRMLPIDNCPIEEIDKKLKNDDFRVVEHRGEMYGYCKDCDKK